ncbi:hypothetical protein RJ640_017965 [Escallonia rubra]|uniref:Adenylate isopentenyltransferase n=1 Tax=Escallonia rubra TaxID=112253 RepID=A0AA88UD45_9ASTE|nr:hypothetical protein RJ640_017965 [Escallonia rubra]
MESTTIATPGTTNRRRGAAAATNSHQKIVVIMGATGSGKSKLSIDLCTRFFPQSEIINSDKMQFYRGLDITTNKIMVPERNGVVHHFLGDFDPTQPEVTPSDYRSLAGSAISDISARKRLPVLVGGSNSFIYALLAKRFDPESDVFNGPDPDPVSSELRYSCCFIWVDVSLPVLNWYLAKRVDEMLDSGMLEELAEFYDSDEFDSVMGRGGLGQAIGVPELRRYFSKELGGGGQRAYEDAVGAIKENTRQLARRQVEKIKRLREGGWDLRSVDATEAFRAVMGAESGGRTAEVWERQVVEPSVKIVKRFLDE